MTDNLSKSDRKRTMRSVKSERTSPELRLHNLLAANKISGWNRHPQDVRGHPDFAFRDKKIALFVDGCFWHRCPVCRRRMPQSNVTYWRRKIRSNVHRDSASTLALRLDGWRVIRIWEHRLAKGRTTRPLVSAIQKAILERQSP